MGITSQHIEFALKNENLQTQLRNGYLLMFQSLFYYYDPYQQIDNIQNNSFMFIFFI
jgi:hypothetical protein